MTDLVRYARILFLNRKLSQSRLKDFTEYHIQALIANNPGGIFTPILAAVTTAYNNYFGDLSSESLNKAVKEGKTIAMKNSREALEKIISANNNFIAYAYKDKMDIYEAFYPYKMKEYLHASLSELEIATERYKGVLARHAADFPTSFVTEFNDAQALFVANRNAQTQAKGSVSAERSDLITSRKVLAKQLTANLLTISLQYLGDESKIPVYFREEIIHAAFAEKARKVNHFIQPGKTQNVFSNISKPALWLTLTNSSKEPLLFGFAENAAQAIVVETGITVPPNETIRITAGAAGWTKTNKYLNVTNPNRITSIYGVKKG